MPQRQSAPNDIADTTIGGTFAQETVSTNQFSNGSLDTTQFYDFEDDLSVASGKLSKEVGGFTDNFVSHRKYYLAECAAIVGPVLVIPDLGGHTNCYLHIKSRDIWAKQFEAWLESPSEEDVINSSDEESDADSAFDLEQQCKEQSDSE